MDMRDSWRLPLVTHVDLIGPDQAVEARCLLRNIGLLGACLISEGAPLPMGKEHAIRFRFPDSEEEFIATGRVVWTEAHAEQEGRYVNGLEFIDIEGEQLGKIERYSHEVCDLGEEN